MFRLNGIVLSIATLLAPAPALAAQAISAPDPFGDAGPAQVFARHPDLAQFTTVGSPDGQTFVSLPDETMAALSRVQGMMSEANTGWSDVLEVRILTMSAADQASVAAQITNDPRLSALPITYRIVDSLPANGARLGIQVLVSSARAVATIGH